MYRTDNVDFERLLAHFHDMDQRYKTTVLPTRRGHDLQMITISAKATVSPKRLNLRSSGCAQRRAFIIVSPGLIVLQDAGSATRKHYQ